MPGRDDGLKRLTQSQKDRIVELRLDQVSVTDVAELVGCSRPTVIRHWHNYLADASTERAQHLERCRTEAIARIEFVAVTARRGATQARDRNNFNAETGMLRTELRALVGLARIAGYEAPKVLHLAPSTQPTEEEATKVLAEFCADAGVDPDTMFAALGVESATGAVTIDAPSKALTSPSTSVDTPSPSGRASTLGGCD